MNQVKCPSCHGLNRVGAKFCGRCGGSLLLQPVNLGGVHRSYGLGTGRLPPNSLLNNRYLILNKVGQGGMGAVYQVTDTHNHHQIRAVKEMSNAALTAPQERIYAIEQFKREAELLQRLRHPNLPAVTDRFVLGDRHYLVMDFIAGKTLQQMLDNGEGPFGEQRANAWAQQLCDVLDYLHNQNPPVIFRDLKPDNIMITPDDRVMLIDFGIARLFKRGQQKDTIALGTEGFAAPEQWGSGQTDARSDIYSLGATLFHLLSNKEPEAHKPIPPVRQLNRFVSLQMEKNILCATHQDRNQRFPNVKAMRNALVSSNRFAGQQQSNRKLSGQKLTMGQGSGGPKQTSRLTTRLLLKTAQLSTSQLVTSGVSLLLLIVVAAWLITPIIQGTWFWFNVPLIAIVAPFTFAATRKLGAAGTSQVIVAIFGGAITWLRAGLAGNFMGLIFGAVASAVAIELILLLLPKVMGRLKPDDPGAWQREAAWLGFAAAVGYILLTGIAFYFAAALKIVPILSAFLLGAIGWFFGDLVQGYLYLKQTGSKRH